MRVEYDYKDKIILYNTSLYKRYYSLIFSNSLIDIRKNSFRVLFKVFKIFKYSIF